MADLSTMNGVTRLNNDEVRSEKEYELIQQLIKMRQDSNRELEYERFDGY